MSLTIYDIALILRETLINENKSHLEAIDPSRMKRLLLAESDSRRVQVPGNLRVPLEKRETAHV